MNASELYQLTTWITENNEGDVLGQQYQALINAMHNQGSFGEEKDNLLSALKLISFAELSQEQIKLLEKLNIVENLGALAVEKIEDVLFRNAIDIETAIQKISNMHQEVDTGIQRLNSIRVSLSDLIDEEQYELDDEVLMRISFKGESSINNVDDLKKLGRLWFDIGRGISMAKGKSPKDIKIIGATKGSVILELALNAVLVSPFMIIIKQGLTITEKVYNIKKLRLEAKNAEMKLNHFDEKIAEITENAITNISEELFKELGLNTNNQGDKKEALKKSIKKLVSFLEKGGDVDFIVKAESEDETNTTKLLREKAIEIRKLDERILLLENKDNIVN